MFFPLSLVILFLSFASRKSRTPHSTINCFALYISITEENRRQRRVDEELQDVASLSLCFSCLQEASASFAEWEKLMRGLGSRVATTGNPFTEVMGLVTQMYKQTAIAKVMGNVILSSIRPNILSKWSMRYPAELADMLGYTGSVAWTYEDSHYSTPHM